METATKDSVTELLKTEGTFQIIVFKQGDEEYAIHIDQIKEVVITPNVTRMPQTPDYIKGVANIRGNIIAIIDLEEKFNLKRSSSTADSNYTLVVESEDVKMGILVREVPNTLSISSADFDDSVNIINDNINSDTSYIKGIVKVEDRLIIMIDIFKVIDQETLTSIKNAQLA